MTTHAMRIPVSTGDTTKEIAVRDDLMINDNDGVLFCADLAFGYSYPAGTLPRPAPTAPSAGALIRDMTSKHNDAESGSLGNISYAGGGFDFSGIVATESGIVIPGEVLTQLFTNQEFLFCMYFKLPSKADWNDGAGIAGMATGTELPTQDYSSSAEPFLLAQSNSDGLLSVWFQKTLGTYLYLPITLPDGEGFFDDEVCQVSIYKQGNIINFQVKNTTSTLSASGASSDNVADYSGHTFRIGGSPSGLSATGAKTNYRLYRTFVEDLSVSGRSPNEVLNADFDRVIARGVFS